MVKIVGRPRRHGKGFSEELNEFLQLGNEFRKDRIFIPAGIYRFKTFEEAEKWRHKMLRGKKPDLQE